MSGVSGSAQANIYIADDVKLVSNTPGGGPALVSLAMSAGPPPGVLPLVKLYGCAAVVSGRSSRKSADHAAAHGYLQR